MVWTWRVPRADARVSEAAAARRAGLLRAAVGLVVGAVVWAIWRTSFGAVIVGVSVVVGLLALLSPLGAYRVLDRAIAWLGRTIGSAVTWGLMPIVYFLLFLPVGLLLRARGRLRLQGGPDKALASYWIATDRRPPAESYERQF